MPTIYSIAAADGTTSKFVLGSGAWATNRSAGTAQTAAATSTTGTLSVQNLPARGSEVALISRAFFSFDTSGISVAPETAILKIFGRASNTADVIAVRSTQGTGLAADDMDALHGASTALAASDGNGAGTLAGVSGLTYSAEIASWSTTGYNNITLNATALADMASLDTFQVALIEYDMDYLDVAPVGSALRQIGFFLAESGGSSKDPKIEFTAGAAGYGNLVSGIASANIGKINGVANIPQSVTANVGKVIGVD